MGEDTYEDTHHLLPRFRADRAAGVSWWLRGVFEGGGAKGLAYRGALDAVEDYGCWFEAVAGSSAGAITAALIAAGYSPRELDEPMAQLLKLFQLPGFFKAVSRLRRTGEIFNTHEFRGTLDRLLRRKIHLFGVELDEQGLTFKRLHDATGVDLYVVAADVSRQEPIVFHHRYTPDAQVADAVLASASIPFFFDGGMLTSKAGVLWSESQTGKRRHDHVFRTFRTIVDGGVWTNFPMFVFKDPAFHWYMAEALELGHDSEGLSAGPVVGFLLHELVDDQGGEIDRGARRRDIRDAYLGARFEHNDFQLVPIERTERSTRSMRSGVATPYGRNAMRVPTPTNEWHRVLLVLADKALAWAADSYAAGIVLFGVAIAELYLLALTGWLTWTFYQNWAHGWWDFFLGVLGVAVSWGVFMTQLLAVVVLFGGSVLSNWALRLPARRVLYGVATTLVATPGTPSWEHIRPDVIALEIPSSFGTLRVPDDGKDMIKKARDKTKERLSQILNAWESAHPRKL